MSKFSMISNQKLHAEVISRRIRLLIRNMFELSKAKFSTVTKNNRVNLKTTFQLKIQAIEQVENYFQKQVLDRTRSKSAWSSNVY